MSASVMIDKIIADLKQEAKLAREWTDDAGTARARAMDHAVNIIEARVREHSTAEQAIAKAGA